MTRFYLCSEQSDEKSKVVLCKCLSYISSILLKSFSMLADCITNRLYIICHANCCQLLSVIFLNNSSTSQSLPEQSIHYQYVKTKTIHYILAKLGMFKNNAETILNKLFYSNAYSISNTLSEPCPKRPLRFS